MRNNKAYHLYGHVFHMVDVVKCSKTRAALRFGNVRYGTMEGDFFFFFEQCQDY